MSTEQTKQQIDRFLASPEPEVLCISGAWGTGKTYSWKLYLGQASDKVGGVALQTYSYVSLFGINSLSELKYTIFEARVPVTQSGGGASFVSLAKGMQSIKSFAKKNFNLLSALPGSKDYFAALAPSLFLAVRDQIVCLDDIERKGAKLDTADILGMISFLKEERRCKVVLLLNPEQIAEGEQETFQSYLEKVVDVTVRFSPTAAECAGVAVADTDELGGHIREDATALGIRNIRVIRKIERLVRAVQPLLAGFEPQVFRQVTKSLALFGWSYHEPGIAPPLSFLMSERAGSIYADMPGKELTPQESSWNALLAEYGYGWTDDLDRVLADGVQAGYFANDQLKVHAKKLNDKVVAGRADTYFEQSWRLYHDSFADNENEVVESIYASFMAGIPFISPMNLNGTVRLLKDLGHDVKAKEVIDAYVKGRAEQKPFFDLGSYAFAESVTDPDVINAFNIRFAELKDDKDVRNLVLTLKDSWSADALATLAALPVDDYRNLLETSEGADLRRMISGLLQFDNITNTSSEMKEIADRARKALTLIGQKSALNARRVAKYGISVPPEPSATT